MVLTSATTAHANGYAAIVQAAADKLSANILGSAKSVADNIVAISDKGKNGITPTMRPTQLMRTSFLQAMRDTQNRTAKRTQDVAADLEPIQCALGRIEDVACIIEEALEAITKSVIATDRKVVRKLARTENRIVSSLSETIRNITGDFDDARSSLRQEVKNFTSEEVSLLENGLGGAIDGVEEGTEGVTTNLLDGLKKWESTLINGSRSITKTETDAIQQLSANAGDTVNGLRDAHLSA